MLKPYQLCYNSPMKQQEVIRFGISLVVIFVFGILFSVAQTNNWFSPTASFPQGQPALPLDTSLHTQTVQGVLDFTSDLARTGPIISLKADQGVGSLYGGGVFYPFMTGGSSVLNNSHGPFVVTTQGLVLPKKTVSEIGDGQQGLLTYDTSDSKLKLYPGTGATNVATVLDSRNAIPGYERVESQLGSGSAIATCTFGKVVLSGGCSSELSGVAPNALTGSYPGADEGSLGSVRVREWRCSVVSGKVKAFAICANP